MPRALFVCYGGGHAKMVIPLVHELSRRPGWDATVLGLTLAGPQMRAQGISAFGYRDLVGSGDDEALAVGRRLLGHSHDPNSGISVEESIAYLGLSYADLVARIGREAAEGRFAKHGRHAFVPLGPLGRALDKWSPDVVVTTNSPKSERAALIVAMERGIPTVAMEDTLGLRQKFFPEFVPPFLADRLCVSSTIAADNLVESWGAPRDHIRLTGNPAFDRLGSVAERRHARAEKSEARLVVFVGQAYTRPEAVRRLARSVLRDQRIRLVIRRHPNYRRGSAAELTDGLSDRAVLGDDLDLDDLLVQADCFVGVSSTSILEAVIVGIPVVQLGPATDITDEHLEYAGDLPLYRSGATLLAATTDEVPGAIADALDPRRGRELTRSAATMFVPPGTAAFAVAEQMRELTSGLQA